VIRWDKQHPSETYIEEEYFPRKLSVLYNRLDRTEFAASSEWRLSVVAGYPTRVSQNVLVIIGFGALLISERALHLLSNVTCGTAVGIAFAGCLLILLYELDRDG
jgi:hypothetical protein